MGIQAWGATDVGRKRKHNEDSFLVDSELGLYIVADGMGGRAAGEVASRRCVDAVRAQIGEERELLTALETDPSPEAAEKVQGLVERAVQRACREIFALAEEHAERRGMGTTVVLLLACGRKGIIGHVGDSRAYVQRNERAHQLTEDHSLVEEQVKRGLMTRAQASKSDVRNVITRAVGVQTSVEVDTLVVDLLPGDVFVLCTDGLHGYLEPGELELIVRSELNDELAAHLIELANTRGGKDNVTALVVFVAQEEAPRETVSADQKVELLRRIPLFQYMTYKELLAILSIAQARHYEAGDAIVSAQEAGNEMFVIVHGQVDVRRGDVSFAQLRTGGHFGEMSLVDNAVRSASVSALEPTHVLALGRDALLKLMRKDSLMAVKLLWAFTLVLSERLRHSNETVVHLRDEVERLRIEVMPQAPFGDVK
jgi:serine/threonine protein phosphatase PrpC